MSSSSSKRYEQQKGSNKLSIIFRRVFFGEDILAFMLPEHADSHVQLQLAEQHLPQRWQSSVFVKEADKIWLCMRGEAAEFIAKKQLTRLSGCLVTTARALNSSARGEELGKIPDGEQMPGASQALRGKHPETHWMFQVCTIQNTV